MHILMKIGDVGIVEGSVYSTVRNRLRVCCFSMCALGVGSVGVDEISDARQGEGR